MTALSELEKRILCVAFHSETPKEPLGDIDENNHIFPYAFGPNDYFSPLHLPRNLNLPEKMQVTCAIDPSSDRLNLRRVIITDLQNPQDIYCDASFALPITAETASSPGATARPAFSPPAPPEVASWDALRTARAPFSGAARGRPSLVATAPISSDPEVPATRAKAMRPATEAEIMEHLEHPDGTVRSTKDVIAALHDFGSGASTARITPLLQGARGVLVRRSATDGEICEQLKRPDGTLRTRDEVVAALHAHQRGADVVRLNKLLQKERGLVHLPSAPNAAIRAQLKCPDGTARTREEVLAALRAIGWGSSFPRIRSEAAKELQQRAATGSQAGEE